ncbi:PqqD family protein [Nostocoides sp. HKS02]|uniref:PqqD family protein n=1 Tax=Nostocoides sp. HKS02 TaxID=1813880 RepID=UPI0018A7FED4|nr:PqqD family protein [Tetrasphaera sp. HKS02]
MPEPRVDEPVWHRSPDVAVVDHGERVVVLDLQDPQTARPLVMEGSAAAIWHALAEPRTTDQVVAAVALDFGLPATEVAADVRSFLTTLSERGLAATVTTAAPMRGPTSRPGQSPSGPPRR